MFLTSCQVAITFAKEEQFAVVAPKITPKNRQLKHSEQRV
jgi:hypothetical protein